MDVEYRIARNADIAGWIGLRRALWPDCPVERHNLEIEQAVKGEGVIAVAETDGQLVGFAEVSVRRDHVEGTRSVPVPYLEGWFVSADQRGKGIGRGLMEFVEQWAVGRGFSELASDAEIENALSIKVHAQLGFTEVARTVHFVKALGRNKS